MSEEIKFRGYAHGPNSVADSAADMVAFLRVYFRDDPRGPVPSFECKPYESEWMIYGANGVIGFCNAPLDFDRRAPSEAVGMLRDVMGVIDTHADYQIVDVLEHNGTLDKIRRFLAAQEKA